MVAPRKLAKRQCSDGKFRFKNPASKFLTDSKIGITYQSFLGRGGGVFLVRSLITILSASSVNGRCNVFGSIPRRSQACSCVATVDLPDGRRLPIPVKHHTKKYFDFQKHGIRLIVRLVPFRSEGRVANVTKREAECECCGSVACERDRRAVFCERSYRARRATLRASLLIFDGLRV
jgi:hypothetical protein